MLQPASAQALTCHDYDARPVRVEATYSRVEAMTKATLRPAIVGDEPYLRSLEEACMRDYAIALWGGHGRRMR